MKKLAVAISSALMLASAGANANVYLGGKVGNTWLDDATCSATSVCDDDDMSGGLIFGYDFSEYIAIEGGYDYLGEYHVDGVADDSVQAWTLAPKLSLPLTDSFSAYGKVGGAYVEYGNESDASYLGALGVEYDATENLSIRAEYQRITDISNDFHTAAADSATLGMVYKFGSSAAGAAAAGGAAVAATEEKTPEEVAAEQAAAEQAAADQAAEQAKEQAKEEARAKLDKVEPSDYPLNSTAVDSQSKDELAALALFLNQNPEVSIELVGHTDSSGSSEYNQTISEQRAQAVADELESQGVESSRITVSGQGESNPIASNDTAEGRSKNRRVEIKVPGYDL